MNEIYEDQAQQDSPYNSVPPYIPVSNYMNNDLVKMAMTSSDLMDELKVNLLGLEWDSQKESFQPSKKIKRMISEAGAWKVITVISSIVNRNTHLSIINEKEQIPRLAEEAEENLRNDFFDNYAEYWENEWEAESNWPLIQSMAGNYVILALQRAIHGREKDILAGNTKTLIQKSEQSSRQQITQNPEKRFGIF
jgi:hypothetical protein